MKTSLLTTLTLFLLWVNTCQAQDSAQRAEQQRLAVYEASQSITAAEYVGRNLDKDLEILSQLPSMRELLNTLDKEFANDIASGQQPFRNLAGTIRHVRGRINEFEAALKDYASPMNIAEDASHVRKMIAMSIEYQAPAYYRPDSDIAIRTQSIHLRVKAMEQTGYAPTEINKAKTLVKQLEKESRLAQAKLIDGILQANELPQDMYQASDREELLKLVRITWTTAVPKSTPLKIGLIGDNWDRTQKWEIQNRALVKVDRSRLQGFVIVAHDDKTVACRYIQLHRDHVNNDKTTAWLLNDPKLPPEPMELILKSKVR